MERLSLKSGIPEALRGGVVALGNFDGFHLGHQAVVGRAVAKGHHERRPVIVATFDPHPVRHFQPDAAPFRLTTLDQRERLFAQAGADAMLVFELATENAELRLQLTEAQDHCIELAVDAGDLHAEVEALRAQLAEAEQERDAWRSRAERPSYFYGQTG